MDYILNNDWPIGDHILTKKCGIFLELGLNSDCEFRVDSEDNSKTFKAHRLILAIGSPVFEAMFFGAVAEKEKKPIAIPDVEPHAFESMLQYIYTEEVILSSIYETFDLFYAAKKYMISSLVKKCTNFIVNNLNPENVCRIFVLAKFHEDNEILQKTTDMIRKRITDIIDLPLFCEIELKTLEFILSLEELYISENELWEGCVNWATNMCNLKQIEVNGTNQRIALQPVLHLFRFLAMTPKGFAKGVGATNILTDQETLTILLSISSETNKVPSNFCTSITGRYKEITDAYIAPFTSLVCKVGKISNETYIRIDGTSSIKFRCSGCITIRGIRLPNIIDHLPGTVKGCSACHQTLVNTIHCEFRFREKGSNRRLGCLSIPAKAGMSNFYFKNPISIHKNILYSISLNTLYTTKFPEYLVKERTTSNDITFDFFPDTSGMHIGIVAILFSDP